MCYCIIYSYKYINVYLGISCGVFFYELDEMFPDNITSKTKPFVNRCKLIAIVMMNITSVLYSKLI
jgi:hypothetical protein